jgi:hypothetical protein
MKCCTNVQKVTSPSSTVEPGSGERRPSLPYFSEDSVRKAKRDSLKNATSVESTTKDELQFLRQITGGGADESNTVRKQLFDESSTSSVSEAYEGSTKLLEKIDSTKDGEEKETECADVDHSDSTEESATIPKPREKKEREAELTMGPTDATSVARSYTQEHVLTPSKLADRLGGAIISRTLSESEEKTELWQDTHKVNDSQLEDEKENGQMNDMKRAVSWRDGQQIGLKDLPKSHSFSSHSRQISRSSSFQLHFGNDDENEEIVPDDDFLNDDWDE